MKFFNGTESILNICVSFFHGNSCEDLLLKPQEARIVKYDDGSEVVFSDKISTENNNFFVPHEKNLVIGRGSTVITIFRQ